MPVNFSDVEVIAKTRMVAIFVLHANHIPHSTFAALCLSTSSFVEMAFKGAKVFLLINLYAFLLMKRNLLALLVMFALFQQPSLWAEVQGALLEEQWQFILEFQEMMNDPAASASERRGALASFRQHQRDWLEQAQIDQRLKIYPIEEVAVGLWERRRSELQGLGLAEVELRLHLAHIDRIEAMDVLRRLVSNQDADVGESVGEASSLALFAAIGEQREIVMAKRQQFILLKNDFNGEGEHMASITRIDREALIQVREVLQWVLQNGTDEEKQEAIGNYYEAVRSIR